MNRYIKEVVSKLNDHTVHDPEYKAFRDKTTKLKTLGLRLPVLQDIAKEDFSFSSMRADEILAVWDHIWKNSHVHEAMYLPLFYYRNKRETIGLKEWKIIKRWADDIENWEHSDALSYLYSFIFEKYPEKLYPTFKQWNKSTNSWKQRLSLTSLIYYASPNRKPPTAQQVLSLVKPLVGHKDMYVNKAVGWTLRESYKLYPGRTMLFLKRQVGHLSPNGYSYATEKVTTQEKTELKNIRALAKKK